MSIAAESWSPMIGPQGPPSGANNVRFVVREWFECKTLDELKMIETSRDNDKRLALLCGRDAENDGFLQGIYRYIRTGNHHDQEASDAWVIVNDGNSAWQKMT